MATKKETYTEEMKKMEDIVISVILKCMSEMARMYLQAAVMEELYTTIIIQAVPF